MYQERRELFNATVFYVALLIGQKKWAPHNVQSASRKSRVNPFLAHRPTKTDSIENSAEQTEIDACCIGIRAFLKRDGATLAII